MPEITHTNSWRHLTPLLTGEQVEHLEALERDPAYADRPAWLLLAAVDILDPGSADRYVAKVKAANEVDDHPDPRLADVPISAFVAELHRRGWTDERIVAEMANQRLRRLLAERSMSA